MVWLAGKISEKPYYIDAIGAQVHSLEEINYFVYNYMDLVYADFFSEELIGYIDNELEEKELAGHLREIEAGGSSVQEYISCLLKESGYYGAQELSKVASFVMGMDTITRAERLKVGADKLFFEEKYSRSREAYTEILSERDPDPSKDSFYAGVAFSAGLCCARLFLCRSANAYFDLAYEIFPKADYAKAVVYMSIAAEDDEELLRSIIKYKVSDEALEKIRKNIQALKKEIRQSEDFSEFALNMENTQAALKMAQTYKDEYYRMTDRK